MLRIVLLSFLALNVVFTGAMAQGANQCTPNGCGPAGWLGWLVPNSPLGCQFKAACDAHDICYSRCVTGCSSNAGTPACDGDCQARKAEKDKCDTAFVTKLKADNPGKARCQELADDYYWFVSNCGCKFFRGFIENAKAISSEFQQEFRQSAEAVRAFREYRRQKPGDLRAFEMEQGMASIKFLGVCEDNKFRFLFEQGQPLLVIESKQPLDTPTVRTQRGITLNSRKFLSGIDVTNMSLEGKRFDLKDAAPLLPPEQLRTLRQTEEFQ